MHIHLHVVAIHIVLAKYGVFAGGIFALLHALHIHLHETVRHHPFTLVMRVVTHYANRGVGIGAAGLVVVAKG